MRGGYVLIDFENTLISGFAEDTDISHELAIKIYNAIKYAKETQKGVCIRNLKFDDGTVLTGVYSVWRVAQNSANIYIGVNKYELDYETTLYVNIEDDYITFGTNT